jgi:mono/diheme cytochrome c family protein
MHPKFVTFLITLILTGLFSQTVQAIRPEDNRSTREKGRLIYQRACIWCHGAEGKGDGPSGWFIGRYSAPHPQDFTRESYKFRSTPSGELPTDQDLFRTVTQGIAGSMPSFNALSEEERWQVVAYIKSFNSAFKRERPVPIPLPFPPHAPSDAGIENGRKIYQQFGCQACHGDNGAGDGPESKAGHLRDARDLRIAATNLTDRSALKSGAGPQDLYRSIMTGLDGTPMPSYADQFAEREREAWDLVWYLLSLSEKPRR